MAKYTEWSDALELELAEPFPAAVIQQKRKGSTDIDFVAWHFYVKKLNELVGAEWSMGTPIHMDVGGKLVVGLPVTICGTTRINFGSEDEDKDDYGDAATNSWAQAFKRTCALFGMGLDMYDKRRNQPRAQSNPAPRQQVVTNPATSGSVREPATFQGNSGGVSCPKCAGPMWDNRERKTNPKAPDFKCKNKEGCDGVIWPPKDQRVVAAAPAGPPQDMVDNWDLVDDGVEF